MPLPCRMMVALDAPSLSAFVCIAVGLFPWAIQVAVMQPSVKASHTLPNLSTSFIFLKFQLAHRKAAGTALYRLCRIRRSLSNVLLNQACIVRVLCMCVRGSISNRMNWRGSRAKKGIVKGKPQQFLEAHGPCGQRAFLFLSRWSLSSMEESYVILPNLSADQFKFLMIRNFRIVIAKCPRYVERYGMMSPHFEWIFSACTQLICAFCSSHLSR